jgi:hypothetical protein
MPGAQAEASRADMLDSSTRTVTFERFRQALAQMAPGISTQVRGREDCIPVVKMACQNEEKGLCGPMSAVPERARVTPRISHA